MAHTRCSKTAAPRYAPEAGSARPRSSQTAVRLALPGELGRHAIEEGKKAVLKISL